MSFIVNPFCPEYGRQPKPEGLGQSIQSSVMSYSLWPHGLLHARLLCPSPTLMSIEPVMPSNHLILYCPLLLPSIFPSIRVFSNESVLHISWPKYWSFNFSISPSNEYSGLISFRMDWLDLLAAQGILKVGYLTQVQGFSKKALS